MKKNLLHFALLLFFAFVVSLGTSLAQSPQAMNYQAIVRDNSGNAVGNNTPVKFRFNIHDQTATGTVVFTEVQNTTTNQFGLANVQIGSVGSLAPVNWGGGAKFLQVELDVNNSGTYVDMGTSQLISVPYALYAANSAAGPAGPTGPQGAAGQNGNDGAAGANGATGPTGADGANGTNGADGATGPTGADGANGADGATGPTGADGANGADGATGPTGADGANGVNGADGATGPTGLPGTNGTNGATGAQGATGPTGSTFVDAVAKSSTAVVSQAAPVSTINYVALTGLSYTVVVPAGATYKVHATAHGEAYNTGAFADCVAQYEFFLDGVATGVFQRTYIADFSTTLSFAYGVWSISNSFVLSPGSHTIEVRGAHAGPAGSGTTIVLCQASGFVGQSFLSLILGQ